MCFKRQMVEMRGHGLMSDQESVLKDIDIIDRRLRNMIMNCSLLKCFWFQMNFRLSA